MPATLRTGTALYASALLLDRLLGLLLLPLLTRAIVPRRLWRLDPDRGGRRHA